MTTLTLVASTGLAVCCGADKRTAAYDDFDVLTVLAALTFYLGMSRAVNPDR